MSKLNVDQKSVRDLLQDSKADFLIPDYQRPYAWGDKECQTLWDDIFEFAFPDNDCTKFNNETDEYYLGSIVTFKNEEGKTEIIDGQQRLTTLMLLLRAFYSKFGNMKDSNSIKTSENIAKCIWKTDEFGSPQFDNLKIDSQVATDDDKEEFLTILKTGEVSGRQKSTYAANYKFFQEQIDKFLTGYPSYFPYLPTRILNNCILLPIEADTQMTALRIFSTLNDRGKPLSDADIFKAQFYKFFSKQGKKDYFIDQWKSLEETTGRIFHPQRGTPMDELFTRYMYYERSLQGNKESSTEALRKFYEKDKYSLLHSENTLTNLMTLADFWNDVSNADIECFTADILRNFYILKYAPNGMWTYFTSVYYMKNKDAEGRLDQARFNGFLRKTIGFVWAYAMTNPGVNALRTPIYNEMINIIEGKEVTFGEYKFKEGNLRSIFNNYRFSNNQLLTRSMLAWWAFIDDSQPLPSKGTTFEIEHIYARKRVEIEGTADDKQLMESLGNKALLEKRVNIRAADYRFKDKKKYYLGYELSDGKRKEGTQIRELQRLTRQDDFTAADIRERYQLIQDRFIGYLKANDLIA